MRRITAFSVAVVIGLLYSIYYPRIFHAFEGIDVNDVSEVSYARIVCFISAVVAVSLLLVFKWNNSKGLDLGFLIFCGLVFFTSLIFHSRIKDLLNLVIWVNVSSLVGLFVFLFIKHKLVDSSEE